MVNDLTDKEQIELLKKWWRDYGKSITVAIVLGLGIGFGWRYWHQYQTHYAERASDIYAQLQVATAQNQKDLAQQLTTQLLQHYSKTPYASVAALMAAKNAVAQKNYSAAFQQLNWVMQHAKLPSLKQIARLRAARVLLAQHQPQAAMQLLQPEDDASYRSIIATVKGDIYTALGNTQEATKAYQTAQNEAHAAGIENASLLMKVSQ